MEKQNLDKVLADHKLWLDNPSNGGRANLRGADLWGTNLRGADLRDAYLQDADLQRADLQRADLQDADLQGADLQDANLRGANLRGANLDFSCLSLWCGGQFKADDKINKQLVAHTVRIMELSEIDQPELIKMMNEYKKGWHREDEFEENK